MCRNIRTLHNFDPPATSEEVQAAALQYVRKVSGSEAEKARARWNKRQERMWALLASLLV